MLKTEPTKRAQSMRVLSSGALCSRALREHRDTNMGKGTVKHHDPSNTQGSSGAILKTRQKRRARVDQMCPHVLKRTPPTFATNF